MSASPECKNTDHGNQGLSLCPWVPGLALKGHPGTTAELSASCYTPPRHSTLTATEWTALRARSFGCAAPCPLARRGPHPAAARQRLFGLQRIVDYDKSAPRPVSTPPTEVASRQPWAVVSNSDIACRCAERRVAQTCRSQSLARIHRQSRDNLSARSCTSWDRGSGRSGHVSERLLNLHEARHYLL